MKNINLFPYGIVGPSTIPDIADRILDEYFWIMNQLKIHTCLAYGLCLGFVRDGGYIDGDNDLDVVAIINNDKRAILTNAMVGNGYTQGEIFGDVVIRNIHFHKDRILLDIFFRKLNRFYSSFDKVKYKGKQYPVPHPVEKYLSACYSNWKIPEDQVAHYYD